MNAPKNRGQGNNQSAGSDIQIPTLGQGAAAGPIIQPGEDAGAIAALQDSAPSVASAGGQGAAAVDDFISSTQHDPATAPSDDGTAGTVPRGVSTPREMSPAEMTRVLESLQAQQAQMASLLSSMARNNPVFGRNDKDQFSEVPAMTLEMPTEGSLDSMRRPDQRIEGVDIDVVADMDHAAKMAFNEEFMVINIHETGEEAAENPVVLHVNGRSVAIPRGQDMAVRRKYVELLLRAKPESIKTRITRDGEGVPRNHIDKTRSLKYPFSIVLDRNPRGLAWARKIRAEA